MVVQRGGLLQDVVWERQSIQIRPRGTETMQPMATAAVQARDEGSGVFGFVTALVTLYFTAAMMSQFNEALAVYVGPSMAVIIGTVLVLVFQSKRNVASFEQGGTYTTLERSVLERTPTGERVEIPDLSNESRFGFRSMMLVYLVYVVLVGSVEILGAGLLF